MIDVFVEAVRRMEKENQALLEKLGLKTPEQMVEELEKRIQSLETRVKSLENGRDMRIDDGR